MQKIVVYCGESVQDKCGKELHPVNEVLKAKAAIDSKENMFFYSNNPDFISAIKYIGKKHNVETTFLLNGVNLDDNIEPIFEDLNRALDLINELGAIEE